MRRPSHHYPRTKSRLTLRRRNYGHLHSQIPSTTRAKTARKAHCEWVGIQVTGEKETFTAVRAGAAGGGVDLGPRRRRLRWARPDGPEADAAAGGDRVGGGGAALGGRGAAPAAAAAAAAAPAPALPLPLLLPGALPPVELAQLRRREPHEARDFTYLLRLLLSGNLAMPPSTTSPGGESTRSAPDSLRLPR